MVDVSLITSGSRRAISRTDDDVRIEGVRQPFTASVTDTAVAVAPAHPPGDRPTRA